LERMDGVQVGSIAGAMRKAESAFKFKRPTKVFEDGVSNRPGLVMLPGALAIEGGLPLMHEGQILGAIGVSGVTSQQDGMIAQAGVEALAKMAK
jgi:glc operon protein GlcG